MKAKNALVLASDNENFALLTHFHRRGIFLT
jgi:hypothetical protein